MNNIKELRKTLHYTQKELANLLGMEQTAISKWEVGKALPDSKTLLILSDIFNVSTDYILGNSKYYQPTNVGKDNIFTFDELEIIEEYRSLTPEAKNIIRETLKTFYKTNGNQ